MLYPGTALGAYGDFFFSFAAADADCCARRDFKPPPATPRPIPPTAGLSRFAFPLAATFSLAPAAAVFATTAGFGFLRFAAAAGAPTSGLAAAFALARGLALGLGNGGPHTDGSAAFSGESSPVAFAMTSSGDGGGWPFLSASSVARFTRISSSHGKSRPARDAGDARSDSGDGVDGFSFSASLVVVSVVDASAAVGRAPESGSASPHCRRRRFSGSAAVVSVGAGAGAGPSLTSHHAGLSSRDLGGGGSGSDSNPRTGAGGGAFARSAAFLCALSSVARSSACLRFCAQSAAALEACGAKGRVVGTVRSDGQTARATSRVRPPEGRARMRRATRRDVAAASRRATDAMRDGDDARDAIRVAARRRRGRSATRGVASRDVAVVVPRMATRTRGKDFFARTARCARRTRPRDGRRSHLSRLRRGHPSGFFRGRRRHDFRRRHRAFARVGSARGPFVASPSRRDASYERKRLQARSSRVLFGRGARRARSGTFEQSEARGDGRRDGRRRAPRRAVPRHPLRRRRVVLRRLLRADAREPRGDARGVPRRVAREIRRRRVARVERLAVRDGRRTRGATREPTHSVARHDAPEALAMS